MVLVDLIQKSCVVVQVGLVSEEILYYLEVSLSQSGQPQPSNLSEGGEVSIRLKGN